MRLSSLLLSALLSFSSPLLGAEEHQRPSLPPRNSTELNARGAATITRSTATIPITYQGGALMLGVTHVYYIWYGAWNGNSAVSLLQILANSIGGTPYYAINTTYYDSNQAHVSNAVTFAGATTDNYSQGQSLSDAQIEQVVAAAINSGKLAADPNGVYFVLTSADVIATSGFCKYYCGWHSAATISGVTIKYAFVGDPTTQCPSGCSAQANSPNGNAGADAMASVVAHELQEAVTDPTFLGWYDTNGEENSDKCAWTFGTMFTAPNGSFANLKLGAYNFLIQQEWVNSGSGYCAMEFGGPVLNSVSPAAGALGASVPVTLTGSGFVSGSTLAISGSGVTASNVTVVNPTQITATLALSGTAGARTIAVNSSAGVTNTVNFTVNAAAPTLTGMSPNSGLQGATVPVTFTGTNFVSGATVNVSGTGVTASSIAVVSATQLTAKLTLGAGSVGIQNVYVMTASGISTPLVFTVNPPAPTVTSISPSTGLSGATVPVTITGTDFVAGAAVSVTGSGVTVSNLKVVSPAQITANLALSGAASAHSLAVSTPSGASNTVAFTVNAASPVLTSVSPSSGILGTTVNITLTGSNLLAGSILNVSGAGVGAINVAATNGTTLTGQLTLIGAPGIYSLSIAAPNGTSNTVTFTAVEAAPTLASLSPNVGTQGTIVPVTLTGTNFTPGSTVDVTGTGVTLRHVTFVNSTTILASLEVTLGNGPHAVTVTTPSGVTAPISFTAR